MLTVFIHNNINPFISYSTVKITKGALVTYLLVSKETPPPQKKKRTANTKNRVVTQKGLTKHKATGLRPEETLGLAGRTADVETLWLDSPDRSWLGW